MFTVEVSAYSPGVRVKNAHPQVAQRLERLFGTPKQEGLAQEFSPWRSLSMRDIFNQIAVLVAGAGPHNAIDLQNRANPAINENFNFVPVFVRFPLYFEVIDAGLMQFVTDEKVFIVTRKSRSLRGGGENNYGMRSVRLLRFRFLFWRRLSTTTIFIIRLHKAVMGTPPGFRNRSLCTRGPSGNCR